MKPNPPLGPRPDVEPQGRTVLLEEDLWKGLSDTAEFHTEVFAELGSTRKVSRNDMIASFLQWALESYWEDKGGLAKSKEDRTAKVKRHAESLKKQGEKL